METLTKILLIISFASAYASPRGQFLYVPPHYSPAPMGMEQTIARINRDSAAKLAEAALRKDLNSCLQSTFCFVGASSTSASKGSNLPLTMRSSVESAVATFKQVLKVAGDRQPLPHMHQLVASYELGSSKSDPKVCDATFRCQVPAKDLKLAPVGKSAWGARAIINVDENYCGAVSSYCPGVSISCSLCAMFLPGACADVCTSGALFCGGSALLCRNRDE